jgi:DNA-binding beta-propeller fold protein YncE
VQAGKQVHTIANLNQPQQTYFDAPTNHLFVSSSGDGTVKVFDGTTFALLQTTQLASDADNMRFDATHGHLVVAYGGEKFLNGQVARGAGLKEGALAILDTAGKMLGQIPTDGHPESIAVEKSGARVFTNVPDKKEIVVGDLATYKVLAHWALPGCENYPMAFDEDHHRVFVMCRAAGNVTALDSDSGKPVAVIPLTPSATSDDMFYDASKGRIYVLSSITQKVIRLAKASSKSCNRRTPITTRESRQSNRAWRRAPDCLYRNGRSFSYSREAAARGAKNSSFTRRSDCRQSERIGLWSDPGSIKI